MEEKAATAGINATELSTILDDGSLYVPARIIPPPDTVSDEAKRLLARNRAVDVYSLKKTFEEMVEHTARAHTLLASQSNEIYPVQREELFIEGTKCISITPKNGVPSKNKNIILVNLPGAGPFSGESNVIEATPLASLLNVQVLIPLFRRPPLHPFPADVDDVIAVYSHLLQGAQYSKIGIYGACTGGTLTLQVVSKLLYSSIPVPTALAVWGAGGESTKVTDSDRINHDLDNMKRNRVFNKKSLSSVNGFDVKDPLFSPIYANLALFPPCFFVAGGRDFALSTTGLMHRAYLRAKKQAEFVLFEGMEHSFLYYPDLPEAQEGYALTADFFARQFGLN